MHLKPLFIFLISCVFKTTFTQISPPKSVTYLAERKFLYIPNSKYDVICICFDKMIALAIHNKQWQKNALILLTSVAFVIIIKLKRKSQLNFQVIQKHTHIRAFINNQPMG